MKKQIEIDFAEELYLGYHSQLHHDLIEIFAPSVARVYIELEREQMKLKNS